MSDPLGDPQGTFARSVEPERTHPVKPEDPPPSFRRDQLIVLGVIVLLVVVTVLVFSLLR